MPDENLTTFLSTYDPNGTRTTRIKVEKPLDDNEGYPMYLFEDPDGRVAIVVPMLFDSYMDVDVHAFHADGSDAPIGVMGMSNGFKYKLQAHENAPAEKANGWLGARLIALFID